MAINVTKHFHKEIVFLPKYVRLKSDESNGTMLFELRNETTEMLVLLRNVSLFLEKPELREM